MKQDYYNLLSVGHNATEREIKSAYRKLCHRFHPDKNSGSQEAEDLFKQINEAYRILINPVTRAKYDKQLCDALSDLSRPQQTAAVNSKGDFDKDPYSWIMPMFGLAIIVLIITGLEKYITNNLKS